MTSFNDFFAAECFFMQLKASAARMLLDLSIYEAGKNKVARSDAPADKLLQ